MAGLLDILGSTAEGIGKVRARIQEPAARMRGKVLDELAAQAERRQQDQGQEAYGKAAAALNLNAPDIGAIALLARADPAAASGLLSQAAQSRTPMGQQQLQNAQASGYQTEQDMALRAAEEARRSQAFPGQLEGQRIQNQGGLLSQAYTGLQMEGQRLANQAARNPPPAPQPSLAEVYEQVNGGKLPSGYRAQLRMTPDGGQFLDAQPIEGTPDYVKSVAAARKAEDGLELIDTFLDQLATYGTEKGGGKARLLKQSRDRLLANYGTVMQALGVLQPGDLERLDAALPDPTAFGNQLNPMAAGSIAKVYEQFYSQWQREVLGPARETYWWVDPRAVTPEEQAGGQ